MNSRSRRSLVRWILAAGLLPSLAAAQDPATQGQWTSVFDVPVIAIHAAVLPTGKALLFAANHGVLGTHGVILDPATLGMTMVDPPQTWTPDCSGVAFQPDGNLFVTGGTQSLQPVVGTTLDYTFDAFTQKWTSQQPMTDGRWYPTNLTLQDGHIITMAGTSSIPDVDNQDVSLWDPVAGSWSLLGEKLLPLYPMLHVVPGGRIFKAGPDNVTETYNPSNNSWHFVANTLADRREQGTSVLLPGPPGHVMLFGGVTQDGNPTDTCEIIDLTAPTPVWTPAAKMAYPRRSHNTVILPTGDVLVVGGRQNNAIPWVPAMRSELYHPQDGTFTLLAPLSVPRWYHSTAVLLPDGRVLASGGDTLASAQIYSPPYLFAGPRPVINKAPPLIAWGASFPLDFTSAQSLNKVVLIAPSAVTHANNMTQRMVELATFTDGGGKKTVTAPADGSVAPPGYYMLFVVDGTGVPSVARMVKLGAQPGGFVRVDGGLAGSHGIPGLDGTGALAGGTSVTLSLGGALENAPATLVLGFSQITAPFKGGTLVPAPDLLLAGLSTNPAGSLSLTQSIPAGLPSGFSFALQAWISDPAAPLGFAASNAVVALTP